MDVANIEAETACAQPSSACLYRDLICRTSTGSVCKDTHFLMLQLRLLQVLPLLAFSLLFVHDLPESGRSAHPVSDVRRVKYAK